MIVLNGILMALAILIGTICIVVIAWGYRLSWREGNCHAHFRLHKWSETEEAIQYGHLGAGADELDAVLSPLLAVPS